MARFRFRGGSCLVVLGALLAAARGEAMPTVTTTPTTIIAGQTIEATIDVTDVPGEGTIEAAMNIGTVLQTSGAGRHVRVRYKLPPQRYPQRLVLLLWRRGMTHPLAVRVPLLGRTTVPIRTRPRSQVTFTIGKRVFGPKSSGKRGRLSITILVAPGVTEGQATTVDTKGMRNTKPVRIARPAYNQLAMLVRRVGSETSGAPRYRIALASANPALKGIRLEAREKGTGGGNGTVLPLSRVGRGTWTTVFSTPRGTAAERWELHASIPSASKFTSSSVRRVQLDVAARPRRRAKRPEPLAIVRPRKPRSIWSHITLWSGVGATVTLAVVGTVTGQVASDDNKRLRADNDAGKFASDPAAFYRREDAVTRLQTATIVCFATAGALGIATALYYLLGYRRAPAEKMTSARPRVALRGTNLVLRW